MCRPQFHARFCVCPERFFCVPCLWRPARNVWPCRACVRPDPLAMSLPAAPPVVRQKPGQRHWSDAQWPCHAVLPIFVVASRWGQAGDRFQANHHPPGLAAGTRLHCIAADPSPGRPQDRSARSKYHLRPPSGTPADGAPSAALPAVAGPVCGRCLRAGAAHYRQFSNQTEMFLSN